MNAASTQITPSFVAGIAAGRVSTRVVKQQIVPVAGTVVVDRLSTQVLLVANVLLALLLSIIIGG